MVRSQGRRRAITNLFGWLFVLPFLGAFLVFAVYPLLFSVSLSFTEFGGIRDPIFIAFDNFRALMNDNVFKLSIFNTFWIWITCFVFQVVVAMVLAGLLTYGRVKGRQVWMSLFYFPNLVSSAVMALLFANLFNTDVGVINVFLRGADIINEPIAFMGNRWITRAIVSFIIFIQYFGVFVIYMSTTMNSIPTEIYESALVDGCKGWKAFTHITLPLMRPILFFIFVTSIVGGMQIFEQPYLLTDTTGAPANTTTTLMMYVYRTAFQYHRLGYSAAVAMITLLIILLLAGLVSILNAYLKRKYI